jgi:3-deoxy-D-manno-octulosonic-acid transferase
MHRLYNLLLALAAPLALPWYAWQVARGAERTAWRERLGGLPTLGGAGAPRIWVHAVSVGEVTAAEPVLRELRARWPHAGILLSTTTRSAQRIARERALPVDLVAHYPVDLLPAVRRALRRIRPDLVVLTEWEIWPNFVREAARSGAVVAVVNGRVSERGLRRARRVRSVFREALERVDAFLMQSEVDAGRAMELGAPAARVAVVGNSKFEERAEPLTAEAIAAIRRELGIPADAPVWVCGSTRPGEEALIGRAWRRVLARHPGLVTIVAPRHLARAEEAATALRVAGARVRLRSAPGSGAAAGEVLLLDTLGELASVYALADCAFVGGSLLPFGGQSLFQPLAQGIPVLFGPYVENQREIAGLCLDARVGFRVQDERELAAAVVRLLSLQPEERREIRARARGVIEANRGVARRTVAMLAEKLAARQPLSAGRVG